MKSRDDTNGLVTLPKFNTVGHLVVDGPDSKLSFVAGEDVTLLHKDVQALRGSRWSTTIRTPRTATTIIPRLSA